MALPRPERPPGSIVWTVEGFAPGIYRAFIEALLTGLPREPVFLTSWWRSPSKNVQVGGARDSQHLIGLAVDLGFLDQGAKEKALAGLSRQGLVALDFPDHVHVQAWPAGVARRSGLLSRIGL